MFSKNVQNTNQTAQVKTDPKAETFEWVQMVISAVVVVTLLFTFVMRSVVVSGDSMTPNLQNNNSLIASRLFYTPQFGDIVVVTQPNAYEKTLIKRVIATAGQTVYVDVANNQVLVDGQPVNNDFIREPMLVAYGNEGPVEVPEGYVYVMGDNRNASADSRTKGIGLIDVNYIAGRIVFGLAPFGPIESIEK